MKYVRVRVTFAIEFQFHIVVFQNIWNLSSYTVSSNQFHIFHTLTLTMTLEDEELEFAENETDGEWEFVVEEILDNGWMYNGKKWIQHSLVKWKGYDAPDNTWESKDNLLQV